MKKSLGNNNFKYFIGSLSWTFIAKLLDAGFKFVTIPLLLAYYGEDNYGILTLALAVNAYMELLNMGVNIGSVKFYSQWLVSGNMSKVYRVAQTNTLFYLIVGIVNSTILVFIALYGNSWFDLSSSQFQVFQKMLLILAVSSIFNWITFVYNQLLVADERISFTQKVLTLKAVINFLLIIVTIKLELSLISYFMYLTILNASIFFPYLLMCKKEKLIKYITPAFYWKDFSPVFRYSIAILVMGIFQFTATKSRPIVLSIFSNSGVSVLAEYRIVEVFPIFIISIAGMLISILLPKASKAIESNDKKIINKIAYEGTKYSTIIISTLCYPLIINAEDILLFYVGVEYTHLYQWLSLWSLTLVLVFHNSPAASLVLATGKTRMLVFSSAFSCTVSIIINIFLSQLLGVGSAVIGYFVYVVIQILFYYLYFNKRILKLDSNKIFVSFIKPSLIGGILALLIYNIDFYVFESVVIRILVTSFIWLVGYILLLFVFKLLSPSVLKKDIKI